MVGPDGVVCVKRMRMAFVILLFSFIWNCSGSGDTEGKIDGTEESDSDGDADTDSDMDTDESDGDVQDADQVGVFNVRGGGCGVANPTARSTSETLINLIRLF